MKSFLTISHFLYNKAQKIGNSWDFFFHINVIFKSTDIYATSKVNKDNLTDKYMRRCWILFKELTNTRTVENDSFQDGSCLKDHLQGLMNNCGEEERTAFQVA